jgi:hypothetical protein
MKDKQWYGSQLDNPDVRKQVTLEIERHSAQHKLSEMKARFKRIAWRTALIFAVTLIINWAYNSTNSTIVASLIYATILSLSINFAVIIDVLSNWRDMVTAKRDLRSWNQLISDYNKKITEEDYLNESKKIGGDSD